MLLILQRRGRTTARELAEELEVSERTILRDVEVLSEAGVPVYTTQGKLGGIELLDGFQTNLTGLTTDEAQSLFLAGAPQLAHRLGLGAPARATREKLLNALPATLAAQAEAVDDWLLHDPDPWDDQIPPHGELRRIARSIQRRRIVEVQLADDDAIAVRPLGLVLKVGIWHLVHLENRQVPDMQVDGVIQVVSLAGLRSTRLTKRPFEWPADFDLRSSWTAWLAR